MLQIKQINLTERIAYKQQQRIYGGRQNFSDEKLWKGYAEASLNVETSTRRYRSPSGIEDKEYIKFVDANSGESMGNIFL